MKKQYVHLLFIKGQGISECVCGSLTLLLWISPTPVVRCESALLVGRDRSCLHEEQSLHRAMRLWGCRQLWPSQTRLQRVQISVEMFSRRGKTEGFYFQVEFASLNCVCRRFGPHVYFKSVMLRKHVQLWDIPGRFCGLKRKLFLGYLSGWSAEPFRSFSMCF